MNLKSLIVNFVVTFAIAFAVTSIAILLWNLIQSGTASVDWAASFRLAFILGIAFPLVEAMRGANHRKWKNDPDKPF